MGCFRFMMLATALLATSCGTLKSRSICYTLDQGFVFPSATVRSNGRADALDAKDQRVENLSRQWNGLRGHRARARAAECVVNYADARPEQASDLVDIVSRRDEFDPWDVLVLRSLLDRAPPAPDDVLFFLYVAHAVATASTGSTPDKHRSAVVEHAYLLASAANMVAQKPDLEYEIIRGLAREAENQGAPLEAARYWNQLLQFEPTSDEPVKGVVSNLSRGLGSSQEGDGARQRILPFCQRLARLGRIEQAMACVEAGGRELWRNDKTEILEMAWREAVSVDMKVLQQLVARVPELAELEAALARCEADPVAGTLQGREIMPTQPSVAPDLSSAYALAASSASGADTRRCYVSHAARDCMRSLVRDGTCDAGYSLAQYAETSSDENLRDFIVSLYAVDPQGATLYQRAARSIDLNDGSVDGLFLFHATASSRLEDAPLSTPSCRLTASFHRCQLETLASDVADRELVEAVGAAGSRDGSCDWKCAGDDEVLAPDIPPLWRVAQPAGSSEGSEWDLDLVTVGVVTTKNDDIRRVDYELRYRLHGNKKLFSLSSSDGDTGFAVSFKGRRGFCDYRVAVLVHRNDGDETRFEAASLCDVPPPPR